MRIPHLFPALFAAAILPAIGADWAQWRGPHRDGHATAGQKFPASLNEEPKVIWRLPAGPGLSSPVIAAGKVLAFDAQDGDETLRLLDAQDGRELWRRPWTSRSATRRGRPVRAARR